MEIFEYCSRDFCYEMLHLMLSLSITEVGRTRVWIWFGNKLLIHCYHLPSSRRKYFSSRSIIVPPHIPTCCTASWWQWWELPIVLQQAPIRMPEAPCLEVWKELAKQSNIDDESSELELEKIEVQTSELVEENEPIGRDKTGVLSHTLCMRLTLVWFSAHGPVNTSGTFLQVQSLEDH